MTELTAPAKIVATASAVWSALTAEAADMHRAQDRGDYLAAVADRLGTAWRSFADDFTGRLGQHPYSVIVRANGAANARPLLAALALCTGDLVNPYWGRVPVDFMQEIVSKGRRSPDLVWLWHTDSANWPAPNDYSALACVRAAPAGGATETLSLDTMRACGRWQDGDLRALWESDFGWEIDRFLGGGTVDTPPISGSRLRFRREIMRGGGAPAFHRATEAFARLADSLPPDVSALLRPGDVLVFDNRKVMHRSGSVEDPQHERLLLRAKIGIRPTSANARAGGAPAGK